jgi:hypothetical protein
MRRRSALETEDREVRGDGSPQQQGHDNVVRLPRQWLGPPEELVPFGPSAADGTAGSAPAGVRLDGADFWGEDSAALQAVVETPAEDDGLRASGRVVSVSRARGVAAAVVALALALVVIGSVLGRSGGTRGQATKISVARLSNGSPVERRVPAAEMSSKRSLFARRAVHRRASARGTLVASGVPSKQSGVSRPTYVASESTPATGASSAAAPSSSTSPYSGPQAYPAAGSSGSAAAAGASGSAASLGLGSCSCGANSP